MKNFTKLLFICLALSLSDYVMAQETVVANATEGEQCIANSGDSQTFNILVTPVDPANEFVEPGSVSTSFDMYHSWSADVEIVLCAPDGTTCATILFFNADSGSGDYGNAGGDDYGVPPTYTIADGNTGTLDGGTPSGTDVPPGAYGPEEAFSVFDGVIGAGTWTLTFSDDAGGDDGCMQNVALTLDLEVEPLPVELISFNAKAMEDENMITWSTASEENTEWHIVERSVNGQSDWEVLGRIAAAGTSSEIISYEYMDEKPLAEAYYRLRSLDYDGYVDMSAVVRVERERVNGDVSVYPNPTKGTANVEFELAQNESVTVTLTDITGKVISYETINAQRGANNHQIEMGNLSNGIYFISMETSLGKTTERIVKN